MKKILITLLITLGFSLAKAQTSDSTANKLIGINETLWVGKPLDSLINALPSGYTSMKVFGIRNTARFLGIRYPNRIFIELNVREFHFMEPNDPNWIWNVNLMRKEKLHSITVYYGTRCYKGCPQY